MSEERIDFSALDPTADAARFDGLVRAVRAAGEPELRRLRARPGVMAGVVAWTRPALAAAAVLAALSVGTLARQPRAAALPAGPASPVAAGLGIPEPLSTLLAQHTPAQASPGVGGGR